MRGLGAARGARLGGGVVESYPEDVTGKVSSSFLHNGTLAMFERHGFVRDRQIGKSRWVVRKTVGASSTAATA